MQASKKTEQLSANNLMLVMILISLLVVGATGVIAKSLISGIMHDNKVLGAWNLAATNIHDDNANAQNLISAYKSIDNKALLADALPNDGNFPGILVAMENMAADAGLTLKSVAPGQVTTTTTGSGTAAATTTASADKPVKVPDPQTYHFSIAFDTTYAGFQKFLGDVETYSRPMRVTSVHLTGTGSALSGTADVETYYQDKAELPFGKEYIK